MLIALGGTISAKGHDRVDLKDYTSGLISPDFYIKDLPEIKKIAQVDVNQLDNVSSTAITMTHWLKVREKIIQSLHEDNYDGIVITHGTNTLEETAYFLHLTVPTKKPIVLTGSQRPYTSLSSDAHMNIINSIKVATAEESIGKGVLVVLNDEISSAREVTKTNTYRLDAFQSGQFGFLGFVDPDGTVQYYRSPTRKHTTHSRFITLNFDQQIPNVEIVYSYAGATGSLIRHISTSPDYKGIVMAGTGAGLVSPDEEAALNEAVARGLTVVRSNRVGNGRVVAIDKYRQMQFIHGDNLLPQKARILLMLALMAEHNCSDIQAIFNKY